MSSKQLTHSMYVCVYIYALDEIASVKRRYLHGLDSRKELDIGSSWNKIEKEDTKRSKSLCIKWPLHVSC